MDESPQSKPETEFGNSPATGTTLSQQDVVLNLLEKVGEPLTRENYLNLAYLGNPPKELSPEEEMELPESIRQL